MDSTLLAFLRARPREVGFTVPTDVMLIQPLAISDAGGCAHLKGFREVLDYNNMMLALSKSGQCEAAGTIWMCEVSTDSVVDTLSVSQVESAMGAFSQEAFLRSSNHAPNRRYSFDVPLPVQVVDTEVAQKTPAASGARAGVLMAQPLPLLAGGALVVGWYAQMQEALLHAHEDEVPVFKLLEAGLSVRSFRRASSRRLPQPPRTRHPCQRPTTRRPPSPRAQLLAHPAPPLARQAPLQPLARPVAAGGAPWRGAAFPFGNPHRPTWRQRRAGKQPSQTSSGLTKPSVGLCP